MRVQWAQDICKENKKEKITKISRFRRGNEKRSNTFCVIEY